MADLPIRDVPDEVTADLDAHAGRPGMSRSEYLRRRPAVGTALPDAPVRTADLERFSGLFADLGDPERAESDDLRHAEPPVDLENERNGLGASMARRTACASWLAVRAVRRRQAPLIGRFAPRIVTFRPLMSWAGHGDDVVARRCLRAFDAGIPDLLIAASRWNDPPPRNAAT
ncbi:type II toxin-antitoxin system VapB family antitoxin [Catenulispora pinisilvae]|uniref:type II toxin-antitoxin system VapB family antitoxin n=1 Tax=Catenulispora pinisilvae TaxID=2705253 RepID=UPI001E479334|nr:hypothetical protein [Catenulispora pinisilvae]